MPTEFRIYRSPAPGSPVDYSAPVATTSATTWSSPPLADGVHLFAVRAAEGGEEEKNVDAVARLDIAPDGSDLSGLPRAPSELRATPAAAGSLRVTWRPAADGPPATAYRISTGWPTPSYGAFDATVAHLPGATLQAFTLSGLTPGATLAVGVRAVNAAGEESNTAHVVATVDAGPPDAPDAAAFGVAA